MSNSIRKSCFDAVRLSSIINRSQRIVNIREFHSPKSLIPLIRHQSHLHHQITTSSLFHSSTACFAKAKGKKRSNDDSNDDGSTTAVVQLPDIKSYDSSMEKRISKLDEELNKLQGGRISSDMLNTVMVDISGGGKLALTDVSQISQKNQNQLTVSVFDVANVPFVVKAIRENSSMNLNPTSEGSLVIVNIPKPSKESRELLVKEASKLTEKTKTEIRNIRKDCMDMIKKLKKGSVSEDDTRKLSKEVDLLTEKKLEKITKLFKDKEKKLLE